MAKQKPITETSNNLPNRRGFSEAYDDFKREVDLERLAIDPDEFLAGVRNRSCGREVDSRV
ncbi:MAG: hypothetical protein GY716_17300 [bacterium]|nr:hypothetical protein [bacterium]